MAWIQSVGFSQVKEIILNVGRTQPVIWKSENQNQILYRRKYSLKEQTCFFLFEICGGHTQWCPIPIGAQEPSDVSDETWTFWMQTCALVCLKPFPWSEFCFKVLVSNCAWILNPVDLPYTFKTEKIPQLLRLIKKDFV